MAERARQLSRRSARRSENSIDRAGNNASRYGYSNARHALTCARARPSAGFRHRFDRLQIIRSFTAAELRGPAARCGQGRSAPSRARGRQRGERHYAGDGLAGHVAIGHRDLVALVTATNAGQFAKPTPPRVAGDTRIAARRRPRLVAQIGLARLSGGSSSSASSSDDPASRPGANARTLKKNLTLAF